MVTKKNPPSTQLLLYIRIYIQHIKSHLFLNANKNLFVLNAHLHTCDLNLYIHDNVQLTRNIIFKGIN